MKRKAWFICLFGFSLGLGIGAGIGLRLPIAYAANLASTGGSGADEIIFGDGDGTIRFGSDDADVFYRETTSGNWSNNHLDVWSKDRASLATRTSLTDDTPISSVEVEKDGDVVVVINGS